MTLSIFYFSFWLVMRGGSFVRPTALQRGFVGIWLFVIGWALQVFAAVAEDRMHVGSLYFAAFMQSAFFASLLISLCEMFALPRKYDFALMLHDAHQARDQHDPDDHSAFSNDGGHDGHDDEEEEEDDEDEPTENTPLTGGQQERGSNEQTTFASTYRRSVSGEQASPDKTRSYQPYSGEQSWSGRLPTWTWVLQFLLLAPVPVILLGNLALLMMTALQMTGADGGSVLTPLLMASVLSILLLLPLTPFIHRITHHIPLFMLLVFIGTFIYNMAAFPFSANNRYKVYFLQEVDLDQGTDLVHLSGIYDYVQTIIQSLPGTSNQEISCGKAEGRDLTDCTYDASSVPPNVVSGKSVEELITVSTSTAADGKTASIQIGALDTRTCYIDTSEPIYGFHVQGGGERDARYGGLPPRGFKNIQLWRRDWVTPWNVTLQLQEAGKSDATLEMIDSGLEDSMVNSDVTAESLKVTVRCAWSDINMPSTIPAFTELKKYMPTWAVVTKARTGLVEVKKTYTF
jgi:hypothetical protein